MLGLKAKRAPLDQIVFSRTPPSGKQHPFTVVHFPFARSNDLIFPGLTEKQSPKHSGRRILENNPQLTVFPFRSKGSLEYLVNPILDAFFFCRDHPDLPSRKKQKQKQVAKSRKILNSASISHLLLRKEGELLNTFRFLGFKFSSSRW